MTSQPKKRGRTERRLTDQRLTEQRNAASKNLDRMTSVEIVRLMNREDRKVAAEGKRGAADLCGGGIERANGGAGCSGMSADVWDFEETHAGIDCRRKASGYRGGGRSGGLRSKRGARFAREEFEEQRRRGGGRGERDDTVRAGSTAICAETRGDNRGDYVEPAHGGGAAGEDRDRAGGGTGSVDRVDAVEGGDVAKDGAEHAEYVSGGAAETCL